MISTSILIRTKTIQERIKKTECEKPELLSPAGDMACLEAAISAGCDAVYAGCDRFGARAYAGNFTPDEFIKAIERIHLFGRKIYLTLNTLIKPKEYREIYDFVRPFYECGLDGVIVQDLGIVRLLLQDFKDMKVHASTQMSVSSLYGVKLLGDLGVSRVVTSRELSLKEIREIYDKTGVELECFIHGAMCYSYSGMCLMSSFLGGRSGNRGRCAGPCRQPYSAGEIKDRYLLSMKDMCALDILDELMMAGISSFKIEGRMKSPAYVYGVTDIYRRNIDSITEAPGHPYSPSGSDRRRLVELYSRGGISTGYYNRRNGSSMITMSKGAYKREDKDRSYIEIKSIPLIGSFTAISGENIRLKVYPVRDPETFAEVIGDMAEPAGNHPMSPADFEKHLNKTGGSDFTFESIETVTDGVSFVRVSSINGIRRKALEMIRDKLTDGYKRSL